MFYSIIRHIFQPFLRLFFGFQVIFINQSPIPKGKLIVCAKHTSNLDPIFLGIAFPYQLHFMSKVEMFKIPVFGYLLKKLGAFPVNRGNNDIGAVKTALKILKEDKAFAIFPEGTRSKKGEDKLAFKDGISMIAVKSHSMVLPVYITEYPRFFHKVKAVIGDPIDFSKSDSSKPFSYSQMSRTITEKIEELSQYAQ